MLRPWGQLMNIRPKAILAFTSISFFLICSNSGELRAEEVDSADCQVGKKSSAQERSFNLRVGGGGMKLSMDTLDAEGSARLGGVALAARYEWSGWWSATRGVEVALGGLGRMSSDDYVREDRGYINVSYIRYFASRPHKRWYGSIGWLGVATRRSFADTEAELQLTESGGTLGLGYERMFGQERRWFLAADLRGLYLKARESRTGVFDEEEEVFSEASFPEESEAAELSDTPERRIGYMGSVSLGYRW